MANIAYNGYRPTLRQRIGAFLKAGETGGSPLPIPVDNGGRLDATFYEPSARNNMRYGYKQNSAVFACVATYADAFAEAPLCVYDGPPEDGGKKQPRHPVQTLIRNPNPLMGEDILWRHVIVYGGFGGNCYLQKVLGQGHLPIQLWPYHDVKMAPVPGGTNWLSHYEYYISAGERKRLEIEEIINYPWMVDPARPWMGMSPLVPVAREVDTDSELTRYLKALLENDAVARGLLELPEGIVWTEEERRKAKAQWKLEMGGQNRGDIAIMQGGLKYTRIALNLQELAMDALRGVPEARIAAAFRVPAIVAGLNIGLARATYSNAEEAREMFTEQVVAPRWGNVASQTQRSLSVDYGDDFYLGFDTTRVAAFRNISLARRQQATSEFEAGGITLNEYREALSFPALTDGRGEMFYIDLQQQAGGTWAMPGENPAGKSRHWRGAEYKGSKELQKVEKRMLREVRGYFDDQYRDIADLVEAAE